MKKEPFEKYKSKEKELVFGPPTDYKKIHCTSCGDEVPGENINIHDKVAKCNSCNAVFSIQSTLVSLQQEQARVKQKILRPEGVDLFHFEDEMDISVQQPMTVLEGLTLGLLPFFTLIFTILFLKNGGSFIFPVTVLWAMFLALIANFVTRSKHKIHMMIADGYLTVAWRPRKLNRDKEIKVDEIDQVYVKGRSGMHNVYVIVNGRNGQKQIPIIKGLTNMSQAHYIEQELETFLEIPDRSIPEESSNY